MADSKKEESFKVIDRRLFTETGEFRQDIAEQEERNRAREAATASKGLTPVGDGLGNSAAPSSLAPGAGEAQSTAAAGSQQPGAGLAAAAAPAADSGPAPNHTFQMLVDFLVRNAAMMLGGYQDPRTGQTLLDLEGGREMIDMLDALRETTRGNLAGEDERLLLDVIGQLKLSFMEVSKAAAAAMKEKAKAPR